MMSPRSQRISINETASLTQLESLSGRALSEKVLSNERVVP